MDIGIRDGGLNVRIFLLFNFFFCFIFIAILLQSVFPWKCKGSFAIYCENALKEKLEKQ